MKKFKISVLLIIVAVSANVNAQTNVISTSGDVGIGTLSPSAKLDVNGSLMVDSMATFKDSLRVQKKLIVEQDVKIQGKSVFIDNGKFKNDLKVLGIGRMKGKLIVDGLTRMNGNLKLMSLNPTANPNLFLTVNQNGKVGTFDKAGLISAVYQPIATCRTDQNGNIFSMWKQNPNPNFGILYTGVDCPARVGIGTDSPLAKLDVHGSALFSSSVGIRSYNSSASFSSFYIHDNSSNSKVFKIMSNGSVNIITEASQNIKSFSVIDKSSNDDVFRVMSNGYVYATKVMVRTVPFPDYVFNSNYQLMPLIELETYIKENKHLPNMPTAAEVAENGADLGEINKVLVEKTEELTLYVIELQKELNKLKVEVKKLK